MPFSLIIMIWQLFVETRARGQPASLGINIKAFYHRLLTWKMYEDMMNRQVRT